MGYKNSDFYCDISKLDSLCGEYKAKIEELILYFEHVKNKIEDIESSQSWQGESYESFKINYMSFETYFLSTINAMIQFNMNLALAQQVILNTVKIRNELNG